MNKKILIGAITLFSLCACSKKEPSVEGARNLDGEIRDLTGEKDGYEYAKGVKYFDTYLGDEIPTSIDYPGFEDAFTYHPEDKYFTLKCLNDNEDYKITTQLYFSDIDNDGFKEIVFTNNRFYKPDPENPERNLSSSLDPYCAYIVSPRSEGYGIHSGMSGASVDHYYQYSIDEKGELVEIRYFKGREKPFISKTKYYFAVGDKLYHGSLRGSEEVDRIYL